MAIVRSGVAADLGRLRAPSIETIDSQWPSVVWVGSPSQDAVTRWRIGGLQAVAVRGAGFQIELAPPGLGAMAHSVLIVLVLSGSVIWNGESAPQLQARSNDLLAFPRGGEGRIETFRSAQVVALSLPQADDVHPASLGPRLISPREGGGVARALGELATAPPRKALTDERVAHATADAIASLVDLIYAGPILDGSRASASAPTRFERIEAYMRTHFRNASLTPATVADDLSISTRYLHRVLQEHGAAFRAMLIRMRVEACRQHLLDPKFDDQTVAEVAYAAGFNDISQFNRHFRDAFGVVPSSLRSRAARTSRSRGILPGANVTVALSSLAPPVTK